MVFLETPTNPVMDICDIAAVAEIAHARGALVAVDNTFLSPYLQRPLELGADFVRPLDDQVPERPQRLDRRRAGLVDAPRTASGSLSSRSRSGAHPLALRLASSMHARHQDARRAHGAPRGERAARSSSYLVKHPKVERVLYPGLPDHPGHEIQKRQAARLRRDDHHRDGELRDGQGPARAGAACSARREPGRRREPDLPPGLDDPRLRPARAPAPSLGLTEGMVRLSVGIEDVEDLLADLEQALAAV